MPNLPSNELCCGCFSCCNICPKEAVFMEQDDLGYYYPKIDSSKCINCHLCEKSCPILNHPIQMGKIAWKTFGGFANNPKEVLKSTSGAFAYSLSKEVLSQGGIVYGGGWCESYLDGQYIRIDNIRDFDKIRGTKYFEIKKFFYKKLKEDLDKGSFVLLFGCPCNIAAAFAFLKKDYSNLLCCELVCHGITSQKYYRNYILKVSKGKKINEVNLRYKKDNIWGPFFIKVLTTKERRISNFETSEFGFSFFNSSRPSCYFCNFKGNHSLGDLQIGDLWGSEKIKEISNPAGVSLVIAKTRKGLDFLSKISDVKIVPLDLSFVLSYQPFIMGSLKKTPESLRFEEKVRQLGLIRACKLNPDFKKSKRKQHMLNFKIKLKNILYGKKK
jgi:coenzyme F420-reducing hydrogenase beta subunit